MIVCIWCVDLLCGNILKYMIIRALCFLFDLAVLQKQIELKLMRSPCRLFMSHSYTLIFDIKSF